VLTIPSWLGFGLAWRRILPPPTLVSKDFFIDLHGELSMECRPMSRRAPFKGLQSMDFPVKERAMQQMTRQEIEQKMDELAREYVETHNRKIVDQLYELTRELEKMDKLEKQ
jgi:hypothetical protein